MTVRHLVWASLTAGLVSGAGFVMGLFDPAYFDPATPFDYIGSVTNDLVLAVTGLALIVWWRATPVRRLSFLILGAGLGFLLWTVGNYLEEIRGLELGESLYFIGAISGFGLSALAGLATLSASSRWRWSGLVLLAISLGAGVEAIPAWPIAWLAFAAFLARGWFGEPATSMT